MEEDDDEFDRPVPPPTPTKKRRAAEPAEGDEDNGDEEDQPIDTDGADAPEEGDDDEEESEKDSDRLVDDEAEEVPDAEVEAEERAANAADEEEEAAPAPKPKKPDAFPKDLIADDVDEEEEDSDFDSSDESSDRSTTSSSSSGSDDDDSDRGHKHKRSSRKRHRHSHRRSKKSHRKEDAKATKEPKDSKPAKPAAVPKQGTTSTPKQAATGSKAPGLPPPKVASTAVAAKKPAPEKPREKTVRFDVKDDDADASEIAAPPVAQKPAPKRPRDEEPVALSAPPKSKPVPPVAAKPPAAAQKKPALPKKAQTATSDDETDAAPAAATAKRAPGKKAKAGPSASDRKRDIAANTALYAQESPWIPGILSVLEDEKTLQAGLSLPVVPLMDASAPLAAIAGAAGSGFKTGPADSLTLMLVPCVGTIPPEDVSFSAFTGIARDYAESHLPSDVSVPFSEISNDAVVEALRHSAAQSFAEQPNRMKKPKPMTTFLHVLASHPLLRASGGAESADGSPMPLAFVLVMRTLKGPRSEETATLTWNPVATGDVPRVKGLSKLGAPFASLRAVMPTCDGFRIEMPHAFKPAEAKLGATRFTNYTGSVKLRAGIVYGVHLAANATYIRATHTNVPGSKCGDGSKCFLLCCTAWNSCFFEDAVVSAVKSVSSRLAVKEGVRQAEENARAMRESGAHPLALWGAPGAQDVPLPLDVPSLDERVAAFSNSTARRPGAGAASAAGGAKKKRKTEAKPAADEDDADEMAAAPAKTKESKKPAPAAAEKKEKEKEKEKEKKAPKTEAGKPATETKKPAVQEKKPESQQKKLSIFAKPQKPKAQDPGSAPVPAPAAPPRQTQVVTSDGAITATTKSAADASVAAAPKPVPLEPADPIHAPGEETPPASPRPAAKPEAEKPRASPLRRTDSEAKKAPEPVADPKPAKVPEPSPEPDIPESEMVDYNDDAAAAAVAAATTEEASEEKAPAAEESAPESSPSEPKADAAEDAPAKDPDAPAIDSDAFLREYGNIRMEIFEVLAPLSVEACISTIFESAESGNIFGPRPKDQKPIERSKHLITFGPYAKHNGIAMRILNPNPVLDKHNAVVFPSGRRLTVIAPADGAGENSNRFVFMTESSTASKAVVAALEALTPKGKLVNIGGAKTRDVLARHSLVDLQPQQPGAAAPPSGTQTPSAAPVTPAASS